MARGARRRRGRSRAQPRVSVCSPVAACPPRTPTPTASSPAPCSPPTTSTSARARTPPRRPSSWPPRVVATGPDGGAVSYADLESRQDRGPRGLRARGGVARSSSCGCARRCAAPRPPCMPWRPSRRAASPSSTARSSRPHPAPRPRCSAPWSTASPVTGLPPRPPRPSGSREPSCSSASASPPCPAPCPLLPPSPRPPAPASPGCPVAPASAARSRPVRCRRMLPGGRLVADAAAREQVAEVWDVVGLPDAPGRDGAGILEAATTGAHQRPGRRWCRRRRPRQRPHRGSPRQDASSSRSSSAPPR